MENPVLKVIVVDDQGTIEYYLPMMWKHDLSCSSSGRTIINRLNKGEIIDMKLVEHNSIPENVFGSPMCRRL